VAEDFGTAIYTNCAPGQGLDGVGGMQFQSHSSGVGRKALAVIKRHLIYEVPTQLIREHKPIEAFPPSFAHVHEDGIFATAAGVYTGREAAGSRPGNHLTQAIVTGDPGTYRSVRPAQLFRARFWRTEPTSTTQSEPLAESWRPGPLDAAEVGRFVNDQPDGVALLTALLAALFEQRKGATDSRRILFISNDATPVLCWLTAATLLLPPDEALRIGFKVFTTDPARSAMPVVAVHPDWTRSNATVEDDRGYAVFDLLRNRRSAVPEWPEAQQWARLFCEADPYDLSDAVELAAASGLRADAARELALAAVMGRAPSRANTDALVGWLRTGPPALREAYGGKLIDVLSRSNDRTLLRRIADITSTQFPGRNDETLLSLLRVELEEASRPGALARPVRRGRSRAPASPPRWVSVASQAEAERLVAQFLQQAERAAFDAVLRVSAQFGVSVPVSTVREAAAAFVAHWAEDPAAGYDPSAWPSGPPIRDMLTDELTDRARRPESAAIVGDRWWNYLPGWTPDQADVTSPLYGALLSAAMAHSGSRDRIRIVRALLGRPPYPAEDAYHRKAVDALWARTSATAEELHELCHLVPAGIVLSPATFASLVASANAYPAGLPELELCGELSNRGLMVLDRPTAALLASHRKLQDFEADPAAGTLARTSELLRQAPSNVLAAHAGTLARGLLAIDDPTWLVNLAIELPPPVALAYLHVVRAQFLWSLRPEQVAVLFALLGRPDSWWAAVDPGQSLRGTVDSQISDWYRRASKNDIRAVAQYLAPLGAEAVDSWNNLAKQGRGLFRRPRRS